MIHVDAEQPVQSVQPGAAQAVALQHENTVILAGHDRCRANLAGARQFAIQEGHTVGQVAIGLLAHGAQNLHAAQHAAHGITVRLEWLVTSQRSRALMAATISSRRFTAYVSSRAFQCGQQLLHPRAVPPAGVGHKVHIGSHAQTQRVSQLVADVAHRLGQRGEALLLFLSSPSRLT